MASIALAIPESIAIATKNKVLIKTHENQSGILFSRMFYNTSFVVPRAR